ncbi:MULTISPECIES: HNH endonuclease signature motif containing protein [unclassified Gemella]|uniref:HNH endonuclease signature motif containing protein n=1 Tax=unclassified Gemella TaxID=2624949 RepID=UPI0015D07052|nr:MULTISPECIES: HNH endonuclease signature motif containing protein [unclassified Gemella]MBF0709738.1 HNH endonuclease [Gemella sp. GL1.1]NYS27082.1 HNH endonuclease [Gemella sp. GL1]
MEVRYIDGYAMVDGYKFRRDTKTGYYLSTKKIFGFRPRLHVYMWIKHNGEIPKGYQIHHKDENKDNNEIDNLMCMTKKKHLEWHGANIPDNRLEKIKKNLDNIRIKASEWHKSEEGRKWHSEHAKRLNLGKMGATKMNCEYCGKSFTSGKKHGKYCSPNCRSNHRRVSEIDNEKRICCICNSEYMVNKYSKSKTCNRVCSFKLSSITRKNAE